MDTHTMIAERMYAVAFILMTMLNATFAKGIPAGGDALKRQSAGAGPLKNLKPRTYKHHPN